MNLRPILIVAAWLTTTVFSYGEATSPDAIVRDLYKLHNAEKGPFFDRQNRDLVGQYFTKELSDLIVKDAVAADGEVGALDFDPLYETQDPQITDLKIVPTDSGASGEATVEVSFHDSDKPRALTFRMRQDATKAWKIADIKYSDGRTLVEVLRDNG